MKITDIEWGKGKIYIDENCFAWKEIKGSLYLASGKVILDEINNKYTLEQITLMNFEEQVDWSKVEVDTPILVSDYGEYWYQRYFAKFENGKIYAFHDGKTSWTTEVTIPWNYAKLPEEENR